MNRKVNGRKKHATLTYYGTSWRTGDVYPRSPGQPVYAPTGVRGFTGGMGSGRMRGCTGARRSAIGLVGRPATRSRKASLVSHSISSSSSTWPYSKYK